MKKSCLFLAFLISLASLSCRKKKTDAQPLMPDVYTAGFEISNGTWKALSWKNEQESVQMTSRYPIDLTSIAVSGNDIHIVGNATNDNYTSQPKYWKNGQEKFLGGLNPGLLYDIKVIDKDIYIAGIGWDQNKMNYATYWKNGTSVSLNGSQRGLAYGMYFSGSDIYVAGYVATYDINENRFRSVATYWKNGVPVGLTNPKKDNVAYAIAVSGKDVHVVGYELTGTYNVAKYWKNGVEISLTDGKYLSEATDVEVFGNDVYIVGREANSKDIVARYWKNGVPFDLDGGIAAHGIFKFNNDIYISGESRSLPMYWKNGAPTYLGHEKDQVSVRDIFVQNP